MTPTPLFGGRDGLRAVHANLLERWRRVMNLVGPGPVEAHFRDVDAAVDGMDLSGTWADLGSGAGFPGLVLAARWPTLRVHLVESRQKRASFLAEVVRAAGAEGIEVRAQRVEDLPAHAYDGVTGRAFAPPPDLLDHARRLLRPGGHVLLFLQADAALDPGPDFEPVGGVPYTADGHRRRSLLLRYTPAGPAPAPAPSPEPG